MRPIHLLMCVALLGHFAHISGQTPPPPVESSKAEDVFEHPLATPRPVAWDSISKTLRSKSVFRASFEQEKKLVALKRPLRSRGKFLFAAGKGVCWDTLEPHRQLFILTPRGLFQQSHDETIVEISADEQPLVRQMTRIMLAIFSGDEEVLLEQFHVYFTGSPERWSMGLRPRKAVMKKVIRQITLSGGKTIDALKILEDSGDQTFIEFQPEADSPDELTTKEQGYFERE